MIRLAEKKDMQRIMEILKGTVEIMHSEGNVQWDKDYPAEKDFLRDIEEKTLYVSEGEGGITGFICINQTEPAEYEPIPWSKKGKTFVIHRMAVAPEQRRQGIGAAFMRFAVEMAQSQDINCLKTDTYSVNEKMNRLFVSSGFQKRGEMNFKGRPKKFNCYEKCW